VKRARKRRVRKKASSRPRRQQATLYLTAAEEDRIRIMAERILKPTPRGHPRIGRILTELVRLGLEKVDEED
jgi:hypothetical protein